MLFQALVEFFTKQFNLFYQKHMKYSYAVQRKDKTAWPPLPPRPPSRTLAFAFMKASESLIRSHSKRDLKATSLDHRVHANTRLSEQFWKLPHNRTDAAHRECVSVCVMLSGGLSL